jgi:hypothetical protein
LFITISWLDREALNGQTSSIISPQKPTNSPLLALWREHPVLSVPSLAASHSRRFDRHGDLTDDHRFS